jgi:hypothetical protein
VPLQSKDADLVITYETDDKITTYTGKVKNIALDYEDDYKRVDFDHIYSAKLFKTSAKYTVAAEFVQDEETGVAYRMTVEDKKKTKITRTARVEIEKATTKAINRARKLTGAPEDAVFSFVPKPNFNSITTWNPGLITTTPQPALDITPKTIEFTWEEEVNG